MSTTNGMKERKRPPSGIKVKASVNQPNKQALGILLSIPFALLNLAHIAFPIWLIAEDIRWGTVEGTGIEMMFLLPYMIELISIPLVIVQIVYLFIYRRIRYWSLLNLITFGFYVFQVVLFYVLLILS